MSEVKIFTSGAEIKNVERKIKQRLNYTDNKEFGYEVVDAIRSLCAFVIMNHNDPSWCSLLDADDLAVLNYADDLKNFYEHSSGNELSYKIICVLLADIIDSIKDFEKGESEARGVFRFASSGTLFSLFTILGLYENGTRLLANNYDKAYDGNRKFPSRSVPMSANIAFVLYNCSSNDEFKVRCSLLHCSLLQDAINDSRNVMS